MRGYALRAGTMTLRRRAERARREAFVMSYAQQHD